MSVHLRLLEEVAPSPVPTMGRERIAPVSLDSLEFTTMEVPLKFDFGAHMDGRLEEAIETISARIRRTQEAGLGLTMGDLALVIRDAFQMGASAAVDGLTAKESERTMREWEAMERREKAVAKMRAFPPVMVLDRPMPLWPVPGRGSDGSDLSDGSEAAEEGGREG